MNNSQLNLALLLTVSLIFSGCELMGPNLHKKQLIEQLEKDEKIDLVVYPELSNKNTENISDKKSKNELYPGTGNYLATGKKYSPSKQPSGEGSYTLNFDGTELSEVVNTILSGILAENYVFSPKVSGSVTLQTSRPLTKLELLPTLEMLLQLNNAVLVYNQGLYSINPASEGIKNGVLTSNRSIPAGYQIKIVPVRNVAVEELSEIVKPLLKDKTILHVDAARNMMMIAGSSAELARAMEMVNSFDVDVMKGRSFGLFPLQNVNAAKMIEELEQVFNKDGQKSAASFMQFMEIERLNAVLAIVHKANSLKEIERWIYRLDRANTASGGGAIVYRVQHVDALTLAGTLNEIFSQNNTNSDRPASIAPGRKTVTITNKQREGQQEGETQRNIATTTSIDDLGEIKIIPDETNNALIIVATAQDYAVVEQVISQLDILPLQVLIDATIVEVTLTDQLRYGIQWFLSHRGTKFTDAATSGGVSIEEAADNGSRAISVSDLAIGAATGGFGYAFVSNSGDIRAVLDASASDNKLNMISSPSLMVLNNHEAFIQVGDEVPIRTGQSTNLNNSDGIETSAIEQRQTGVKLRVKPRVNANGLVIMDIEQSVEDVSVTSLSGSAIDSPTISTREITSSVAVQSGETIVLGGLISTDDSYNKGGIPLLHEIPLLGPLFGTTSKTKNKTELVVLITPRVVKTSQDARLITNEFKRKLSDIYEVIEAEESLN